MKANLAAVAAQATEADREAAMQAWVRYNRLMSVVGERTGFGTEVATGVFAALSPNNDYLGNLRDTVRLLRAKQQGRSVDEVRVSTYHANKRKAWAMACGTPPLDLLKASKTRSFYLNITNPDDPEPVTVDGHIFNAWAGRRVNLVATAHRLRPAHYFTVAQDVRDLAREHGLISNQMQGLVWFAWKRIHRIKVDGQLELLPADELVANFY